MIIRDEIMILENEGSDLREHYNNSRRDYNKIEVVHQRVKQDMKDALEAARKLSDGFKPDDKGFDKYREKYNSLPKDMEALRDMMDEIQMRVGCMTTADEGEMKEYERGLSLIENIQEKLEENLPLIQSMKLRKTTLLHEWLTPLTELVDEINKYFSNYFESMGCAGEVGISKDKGEECFSDYGLCIKVTYRPENPLQELNRFEINILNIMYTLVIFQSDGIKSYYRNLIMTFL